MYKRKALYVLLVYVLLVVVFPASARAQSVYGDTAVVIVAKGWNLVSLPLQPSAFDKQSLFPSATSMAFKYDNGYDTANTLEVGVGYWMKFAAAETIQILGCKPCTPNLRIHAGWNLVGSFAQPVGVDSLLAPANGNVVAGPFYSYRRGYLTVDSLQPGVGYWVKSVGTGTIVSNPSTHPQYTTEDSVEATQFALWLSGKVRAPDSLVSAMLFNLYCVRHCFQDSVLFSVVNAKRFMLPWNVSLIDIEFDDTTAGKVRSGLYDAWNQFDESLRPTQISPVDERGWAALHFAGTLNPRRLSDMYSNLPGVLHTEPAGIGGWPACCGCFDIPIYPGLVGNEVTYVFTKGVQCSPRWYIKTVHGVPEYFPNWRDDPVLSNEVYQDVNNFWSWDGPP